MITAVIIVDLDCLSYAVGKRNKLNLLGSVIPVGYFIVRLAFALLLGEGVREMITSLVGNLVFTFIYVLLFVSGRQRFNKDKLIK
ncbi:MULTISPECIES: hypothetical protein [Lactiplantibacillus]|uniref:hypothetical protein n=1 Tax=Lactiplantibacillus TaxID=2767842 RepID=UPI000B3EA335|nr:MULTISPECIES: hypothetical protein [Lactiplantibacillus]MCH8624880.1 hypothetical protein [Lactiplantibacillus plantarum]MCH8631539.1 hypothetical protein [Lactiplantibacillus plantarum]MCT3224064.1 hypothetical protein [Lactiplantibacillus plantarum]MCT3232360.1 hypothetical protein [Lactiplantibacillus plantarum]MCT3551527.1 hypothetical protein [Lactiplantibacillus plantarum]